MSAQTTTTTTTRLVKTSSIVGLTVVLLALLTSNHSHAYAYGRKDLIPDYDHDTRDYYLIRAQSSHQQHHHHRQGAGPDDYEWTLHEDQQRGIGDLLGLRFEAAVGQLPDYFVYSAPKRFLDGQLSSVSQPTRRERGGSGLTKRSTSPPEFSDSTQLLLTPSIDAGPEYELEEAERTAAIAEPDPVVQRFHALKREYIERQEIISASTGGAGAGGVVSLWKAKRNDLQADIVQVMGTIERQELRQRNKKRAPLPNSNPSVQQLPSPGEAQRRGEGREAKSPVRRGGGENRPMRPSSSEQEQEEIENAAEDEEVAEEEQEKQEQGGQTAADDEEGEEQEGESSEQDEGSGETQEEGGGEGELDPEDDPKAEYQPAGEEQPEDGFAQKVDIDDPGFRYQWHLHNTKDRHDINVTGVWEQGINGTGVNVAIIDDGLDSTSEDLAPNFFKEGSWDFNDRTALPMPRLVDDQHGTRCAGEIAAAKNDLCGLGVAYGAKVAGLRILSGRITDVDEAIALNYRFQDNHIYSCSWGPPDDGQSMDAPKGVVLDAMKNGIKYGRSGLGSIFVFATGNGGDQDDDCNFDGYTNSLYTVSIGAIDRTGRHPYYSEACSAQLAVTYSNGGGSAIYTCDVGKRRCYDQHGGTSAAAPIAAGMIALVLSFRPDLSWRDVQYLLMTTAIPVSVDDEDWKKTAAGRMFNHKFGYGSLNAYALVEAAKTFQSLGPQTSFHPAAIPVGRKIPQNAKGVVSVLTVAQEDLLAEGVRLGKLEHITVTVNIEHGRRGDVEVVLTSPNNVESRLGVRRRYDAATTGFSNWTFMTVKHWDENPVGEWKLTVRDQNNPDIGGKFVDWRIQFWGETKREVANIKAKPLTTSTTGGEEEQLLSESQLDGGGHNIKPGDVTEDVGGEEMDKENQPTSQPVQPPADTSNFESKVIVDKAPTIPKKLGNKDKENLSTTEHHEGVDPAQVESSGFEPDSEEQVATTVSRTLYALVGVIGVGGVLVGYLTRHKWDGRGQYASVRRGDGGGGGGGGAGHLGHNFVNDDDDIDLLPRGLCPGRSDLSLADCEDDDDITGADGEPRQQQQQQQQQQTRGQEMESRSYGQERQRSASASGFEAGSDTDNEDFLSQSVRGDDLLKKRLGGSRLMKQSTSSPATLLVEHA